MERKHALIITAIDGLATLECGIASMVHWFFETFEEIRKDVEPLTSKNWNLFAISPRISPRSTDFSQEVHEIVAEKCKSFGGDFIWSDIDDDSSLRAVWSLDKPDAWRKMCANVALEVEKISSQYQQVTVIVHGVMLTGLRLYLKSHDNVQIVFVTHSLGRIFEDKHSHHRTEFEDLSFKEMLSHPQDIIADVGPYTKNVLIKNYHIPENRLVSLECGILKNSFRFRNLPSNYQMAEYLQNLGIPIKKNLIFSWGRCTGQKGFDVIIPSFQRFLNENTKDWHLVLLMPQEVSPAAYINLLDEQLSKLPGGSYTAIKFFDELAPQYLLHMTSLKIVIFASRFETGPLTLMETLTFGHDKLRIVWNDIPPIAYQLRKQPHTFSFSPLDETQLLGALNFASSEEGAGIDKQQVPDFTQNMIKGIRQILRWWQ